MYKILKTIVWLNRWVLLAQTGMLLLAAVTCALVGPRGGGILLYGMVCLCGLMWSWLFKGQPAWLRILSASPASHARLGGARWIVGVLGMSALALLCCAVAWGALRYRGVRVEVGIAHVPGILLAVFASAGTMTYMSTLPGRWARASAGARKTWAAVLWIGFVIAFGNWWFRESQDVGYIEALWTGVVTFLVIPPFLQYTGPLSIPTFAVLLGIGFAGPLSIGEYPLVGYPAIALGCLLTWRGYVHRAWLVPDLMDWSPSQARQAPVLGRRLFPQRWVTRFTTFAKPLLYPVFIVPGLLAFILEVGDVPEDGAPTLLLSATCFLAYLTLLGTGSKVINLFHPRLARMLPMTPATLALRVAALHAAGGVCVFATAGLYAWIAYPVSFAVLGGIAAYGAGLACIATGASMRLKPSTRWVAYFPPVLLLLPMVLAATAETRPPGTTVILAIGLVVGLAGLALGYALTYRAVTRSLAAYRMEATGGMVIDV